MACDYIALANKGVQALHPYQPGKPVEELERELGISDIVKLASNENPNGPGARVCQVVAECLGGLSRYPDGNGFLLRQALQDELGVAAEQITLGNGSNDILDLVARAFAGPGTEIIFSEYAFAVYPIVTLACNARPVAVPADAWGHNLDAMARAITEKTRLIFLANPNNPTGTYFSRTEFECFMEKVPAQVLVVLDEAYCEYVDKPDYPDGITFLAQYENLLVTRTFSKAYGLAGLRVGYGVSKKNIADVLNRVRQPFNVNNIALAAATAALADKAHLSESVTMNREGLLQLAQGLNALGLDFIPSVGNFITVDFLKDAAAINQKLLERGVIVRPLSNYGMPCHLRISIGNPAENMRLLDALRGVL